jgi:hypothetical protein
VVKPKTANSRLKRASLTAGEMIRPLNLQINRGTMYHCYTAS